MESPSFLNAARVVTPSGAEKISCALLIQFVLLIISSKYYNIVCLK